MILKFPHINLKSHTAATFDFLRHNKYSYKIYKYNLPPQKFKQSPLLNY